jgi:hypothetical protein
MTKKERCGRLRGENANVDVLTASLRHACSMLPTYSTLSNASFNVRCVAYQSGLYGWAIQVQRQGHLFLRDASQISQLLHPSRCLVVQTRRSTVKVVSMRASSCCKGKGARPTPYIHCSTQHHRTVGRLSAEAEALKREADTACDNMRQYRRMMTMVGFVRGTFVERLHLSGAAGLS